MFSSRGIPSLARTLRGWRPFAGMVALRTSGSQSWRFPSALGLLAGGALLYSLQSPSQAADEVAGILVGKIDDFPEGVMKKIQVGEDKENFIVVAKVGGQVYAVSGKCPHFGAPLGLGYLDGYHIFCPWHAAAFDIRSGEIFGGPSVNSLASYRTRVSSNGDVLVLIPDESLSKVAQSQPSSRLVKPDGSDARTFVVVGGGAAGHSCAETLRKNGFKGRIVVLAEESVVPYDRVMLSKNVKTEAANFALRPADFYSEFGIDLHLNSSVKSIDSTNHVVKTVSGEEFVIPIQKYDKLCIASGTRARVPGVYAAAAKGVKGVITVRNAADHDVLRHNLEPAKNVVIIGSSFLGLETATAIRRAYPDKTVTVVDIEEKPLQSAFGPDISRQLIDLQRKNGVELFTGNRVTGINQADGHVKSVTVEVKSEFKAPQLIEKPADLVILATGAAVNTDFVPYQLLNQDRSVRVDAFLKTDDPHIFAAGDVASFHSFLAQSSQRIEHWAVAQDQGRVAAENMLGLGQVYNTVPFFWTNQFANASFAGYSTGADWSYTETDSEDEPAKTARITYFFKGPRCTGVAVINKPGAVLRLRLALMRDLMPSREELVRGTVRYAQIAALVDSTHGGKWGPGRRRCGRACSKK